MIQRHLGAELLAALGRSPAVFLNGARQTGKSTLVRALAAGPHPARYLTLDDPTTLAAAQADPAGFVAGLETRAVIDEVQRAPGLFLALKAAVDRDRRPGRFLLTGSASVMALPRLADALVGRAEILTLWPFSQGEMDRRRESFVDVMFARRLATPAPPGGGPGLEGRLLAGGFPPAVAARTATDRRRWFASYLTTVVQREVRDLSDIEGLSAMPQLLALIAARTSGLLNASELGRAAALPTSTLKRYLALLDAAFLVRPLPAWSVNLSKRLVRSPKLMLCDSGLLGHLLGANDRRLASEPALLGPLLESFVAMEMVKQTSWSVTRPSPFHFRAHSGEEVDLVLEDGEGRIVGIEVKAASTIGARDLRGLQALREALGARFVRGVVLYRGSQIVPFGERLHALPLETLWATAER